MLDNRTVSHFQSFIDNCLPLESYCNKSSPPGQKVGCKSPRVGQIFGPNPHGCRGVFMTKTDTFINVRVIAKLYIHIEKGKTNTSIQLP